VGAKEIRDSYSIRRSALLANVPYFTTIAAAMAAVDALEADAAARERLGPCAASKNGTPRCTRRDHGPGAIRTSRASGSVEPNICQSPVA